MNRTRIPGRRFAKKSGDEDYLFSSIVVYDTKDTIYHRQSLEIR
jgi:hypothetical protein